MSESKQLMKYINRLKMEQFNKSVVILTCLLVCFFFHVSNSHPDTISREQVLVNKVPENRLTLNHFSDSLKSAFFNTRDYLGQKLSQFSEKFDSVKAGAFDKFLKLYNKQYSASELPRRMKLFFERKKEIDESQELYKQGKVPFEMKVNKFADLDDKEIRSSKSGLKRPRNERLEEVMIEEEQQSEEWDEEVDENGVKLSQSSKKADNLTRLLSNIPDEKDWRETGCIPEPMNQESCGSCYAISTMTMVDSMLCIKGHTDKPQRLSAQQIIDCAKKNYFNDDYFNDGCNNGWPTSVLQYLQEEGVALKEDCYPYANMENADCLSKRLLAKRNCSVDVKFSGKKMNYKMIKGERQILYHVAEFGPVVVTVYSTKKFKLYAKGIFEDKECNEERYADDDLGVHAIVVVGYGQENGVDYWIIHNSWGVDEWGENGFGRIRRGVNACNIGSIGWVIEV